MNTTTAPQTVLHIKNMVCDRCRMAVEQLLQRHEVAFDRVELGKAVLPHPLTDDQLTHLRHDLAQVGFELIDDHRSVLVEAIRQAVMDYVADRALMEKWKLSAYLSDRLAKSYTLLSSAFSAARGMTIERFFILQKVERAKELLIYDELTMSEIAFRLNYSSPAHLSGQFKQITGMSPSDFKRLGGKRHPLDQL